MTAMTSLEKADLSQPLALPAASFDAVLCVGTTTYLEPAVLRDWLRLVRVGGLVGFTHKSAVWPLWEPMQQQVKLIGKPSAKPSWDQRKAGRVDPRIGHPRCRALTRTLPPHALEPRPHTCAHTQLLDEGAWSAAHTSEPLPYLPGYDENARLNERAKLYFYRKCATPPPTEQMALRDIESVDEARLAIEAVIQTHELVIFTAKVGADGTKDCPYCIQVLDALKAKGIAHKEQQVTAVTAVTVVTARRRASRTWSSR